MLGDFRYQPVTFSAARKVRASDRQQLATRAVLLARVQGALPGGGVVYLGPDSARVGIRFGPTLTTGKISSETPSACNEPEARRNYC